MTALAIITHNFSISSGGQVFRGQPSPGAEVQSAGHYLRFHVLAHSNGPDDQSLKRLAQHLLQYLRLEMRNLLP